jgi:heme oxygenase
MPGVGLIQGKSLGALHRSLRTETRGDHLMIDRLMLRFDLTRREDYGLFLNIHYSTLRHLRASWRDEDREDFLVMTNRLQDDLHTLGLGATTLHPITCAPLTQGDRLGIAYVIRGSRLGSEFLRRRVPTEFPVAYLDYVPTTSWAQFLQHLVDFADDLASEASHEVIRGARWTFELFANLTKQALVKSERSEAPHSFNEF